MNRKPIVIAAVLALVVLSVYRWRNPPLKTPTPQEVAKAFPDNSQAIFDGADKFVLYALEPNESMKNMGHKTYFYGFGILGEATIFDKETMQKLRESFYDGLANDEGTATACFNPRHGLRAVKNGKVLDLVICFECGQAEVFINNKSVGGADVNRRPQSTFDRIYNNAGLELAR